MDVPQKIKADLFDRFEISVKGIRSMSGGDINEARLIIDEEDKKYFLKYSIEPFAADMLQKEGKALQILTETQCVPIPGILGAGSTQDHGYLLLEFVEKGTATRQTWIDFAEGLANLHRCTNEAFGLSHDNYIGRLVQKNTPSKSWIEFYIEMRLGFQRNLLLNGMQDASLIKMLDTFIEKVPDLIHEDKPALVHGDLWSGNYHPDSSGKIYLIDPSISYSNREMDIAMSMLFGGFSDIFYEAYNDAYPLPEGWHNRIEIYQLYYLLVHVNLFGRSYVESTRKILGKYV